MSEPPPVSPKTPTSPPAESKPVVADQQDGVTPQPREHLPSVGGTYIFASRFCLGFVYYFIKQLWPQSSTV